MLDSEASGHISAVTSLYLFFFVSAVLLSVFVCVLLLFIVFCAMGLVAWNKDDDDDDDEYRLYICYTVYVAN